MTRLILTLLWLVACGGAAMADGPWAGQWQLTWRDGGALITLRQNGDKVTGSYGDGRGHIEGTVTATGLEGRNSFDSTVEIITATMNDDGASFAGRTETGDWLNGVRLAAGQAAAARVTVDLSTPRAALRSFLAAGNRAQGDRSQALAWVIDALDFGTDPGWASREARFAGAEEMYDLIDLATFSLATIPESPPGTEVTLSLPRLDSKPPISLTMVRSRGDWRILMPSPEALSTALGDGGIRPADAFRQLKNPRDTLRSFLDGMLDWTTGGEAQAVATLDLSQVPDVLSAQEGSLVAQYLVRLFDHVGNNVLQAVPNSGVSREPFVFYENPTGRIVIEPVGTGDDTRWQFSAQTLNDVRRLYRAAEQLPDVHALGPAFIPSSTMFAIRDQVRAHAPILLKAVGGTGRLEYWQVLGMLLALGTIIFAAVLFRRIGFWLLMRPGLKHHIRNPRRLATAVGIGLAFGIGAPLVMQLGLPAASRQYTLPFVGSLLIGTIVYAGWQLIAAFTSLLESFTEKTETPIDNIMLTFVAGVARLALVAGGAVVFGQLWSLPATGLLAGLGVSGLAVAFASKETVANVFGAGILLGDRPFGKGDRIIAGEVNGWVEAVGLRSTRIRTLSDSLLIVPNGRLADMTVNNLGARRRRTFHTTLLITSGATPARLEGLAADALERIRSDELFVAHGTNVTITGFTEQAVKLEISTSLHTTKGHVARAATHKLLLDLMRFAEARGMRLGNGMQLAAAEAAEPAQRS